MSRQMGRQIDEQAGGQADEQAGEHLTIVCCLMASYALQAASERAGTRLAACTLLAAANGGREKSAHCWRLVLLPAATPAW